MKNEIEKRNHFSESQEAKNKENKMTATLTQTQRPDLLTVLCAVAFISALPIVEIIFATSYRDIDTCSNDRIMLPVVWMAVSGIVDLSVILLYLISESNLFDILNLVSLGTLKFAVNYFYKPFVVSWLIIGSIVLWRDNSSDTDCSPEAFRNFFWIDIILRIVGVIYSLIRFAVVAL